MAGLKNRGHPFGAAPEAWGAASAARAGRRRPRRKDGRHRSLGAGVAPERAASRAGPHAAGRAEGAWRWRAAGRGGGAARRPGESLCHPQATREKSIADCRPAQLQLPARPSRRMLANAGYCRATAEWSIAAGPGRGKLSAVGTPRHCC